ncbi:tRNA1(Val) (adenine(37)-N6)-methyltransferase [Olivibacter sitiensis]|uniref:tRNA1(Val) (adenine(37)-N6)-methyltransferase n=1 Tax=Olivibacter sitiensis TaxID=376470 RepID=UPI00040001EA|nr:methyltransferase [Olivibacter sitiensis]
MSSPFQFKQFVVRQDGATMKINTDGVLLAAMAEVAEGPVLDVGTGTGVIAMMLSQRFPHTFVDAIEPDAVAYQLAKLNFEQSPFSGRLRAHQTLLEDHYVMGNYYGLIVSNPPYFIQSLKSPNARKSLARHGSLHFFDHLFEKSAFGLRQDGRLYLIVPSSMSLTLLEIASFHDLKMLRSIEICSFSSSGPFRNILVFGKTGGDTIQEKTTFVIYEQRGVYTSAYKSLLKEFFIHF